MKRFLFAAAFALVGALGSAGTADAQYVYGYRTFVPGGGVIASQTYATPFGVRTMQGYSSPFTGVNSRQSFYADAWGNRSAFVGGFNPYTGFGYRSGVNFTPWGFYGPTYNRFGAYGYRW